MTDELLSAYDRELSFLRRMGALFAEEHPRIAGRLRLGPESVEDPHVARLIESVALLNARIRHKLDDDLPELSDALLSILYPHYLAPIPSMAIARFECDPEAGQVHELPAGALVQTDRAHGEPCLFRTAYPAQLAPLVLASARLSGRPFDAPAGAGGSAAVAMLALELRCAEGAPPLGELAPGSLRFHVAGAPRTAQALYELLFDDLIEVAVASGPRDPRPQRLGPSALKQVGFEREEGLLPYSGRSFLGYRLLTEYFAFPQKFLFFDLGGLAAEKLAEAGRRLTLCFFLRRHLPELENEVGPSTFVLGCAPIVNLFPKRAEPIRLDHVRSEYRVVPDARRPAALEVWSIDRVRATSLGDEDVEYRPLYGIDHGREGEPAPVFWQAARRASARAGGPARDRGTELFLRIVDLELDPRAPAEWVLDVETTCCNRDLPGKLPFGGGQPRMQLVEGSAPVRRIECLTAPTPTRRPPLRDGARWRLVSHLALGHLSLTDGEEAVVALRELLRLYEFTGSPENRAVVESLLAVRSEPAMLRVLSAGRPGFCRGSDVEVELDEARLSSAGAFLFACVLERFLGTACNVNSFTRLRVLTNGRKKELGRWPPRTGDRRLL